MRIEVKNNKSLGGMDLLFKGWLSKPCEKHKTHSRYRIKLLNDPRLWEIPQFGYTEVQRNQDFFFLVQRNLEIFPKSSV